MSQSPATAKLYEPRTESKYKDNFFSFQQHRRPFHRVHAFRRQPLEHGKDGALSGRSSSAQSHDRVSERTLPPQEMLEIIKKSFPSFQRVEDAPNDTSKGWKVPGFLGQVGFSDLICETMIFKTGPGGIHHLDVRAVLRNLQPPAIDC